MMVSRLIIVVVCLLLPMQMTAQKDSADINRLTKEMYRLWGQPAERNAFMETTEQLKTAAKKAGDMKLFWRVWSNQSTNEFRIDRENGLAIAREMTDYAKKHNDKYGLYISTYTNASHASSLKMEDQAELLLLDAISYRERYFPDVNGASDYLALAKIYVNKRDPEKIEEMTAKALQQPDLTVAQRVNAWAYRCYVPMSVMEKNGTESADQVALFNHYYSEMKKARQETGYTRGLDLIVDIYHARYEHDYQKVLELAQKLKNPQDRLSMIAYAYEHMGMYQEAYQTNIRYRRLTDSLNSEAIRKQSAEHSLALEAARAENEAKDLRLANQSLQLTHIADELEQRRLEEEALSLSLQKRDAELAHAATKLKNDSLDKHNKEMQLREVQSKMEAQQNAQRARNIFVTMAGIIATLTIAYLIFYLHRRRKQMQELKSAYDQLEEATTAKERIDSELRIARDIQMGMVHSTFPAYPDRHDIDLFALMEPAKEVGGDLYDFFLQGNKLYFCLGDVSGKGVPASMFMSVAVNLFRLVVKEGFPPSYVATRLNETLSDNNESGMFITMFIGEIDLTNGHMDYCNCGHNPPAIKTDGTYVFLNVQESNAPLGLWPELEFVGEAVDCVWNRPMLIYTDGVNEAENLSLEQFGDERLLRVLNHATQPFGERKPKSHSHFLVDELLQAVTAHVNGAEPSDDMTMLCIEVKRE